MDLTSPYDPETVPEEWWLERMRIQRNALLVASDWTQLLDVPVDQTAWASYRRALRDFPESWTPGPVADFPTPPS